MLRLGLTIQARFYGFSPISSQAFVVLGYFGVPFAELYLPYCHLDYCYNRRCIKVTYLVTTLNKGLKAIPRAFN